MPLTIGPINANSSPPFIPMTLAVGETAQTGFTLSEGGSPINLTGYTLIMQINLSAALALSTSNGGITLTDAALGEGQINISGAETPGTYTYEFWAISGGGQAARLWTGTFTFLPSSTQLP